MKIKDKLLQQIDKKAKKIQEKREEAATNKTIENVVFDFFKNIEESRHIHNNQKYDLDILSSARISLIERLKTFDKKVKVAIEWNHPADGMINLPDQSTVRGITIWWSGHYIAKNNCDPSLYIDSSQMLFL